MQNEPDTNGENSMNRRFLKSGTALALAMGLIAANAQPVPDTVEGHVLAAQKAAGLDFAGTLDVLCIQPDDGSDPGAATRAANTGKPRAIPACDTWYAEPGKV